MGNILPYTNVELYELIECVAKADKLWPQYPLPYKPPALWTTTLGYNTDFGAVNSITA